jgi:hypothetical protein
MNLTASWVHNWSFDNQEILPRSKGKPNRCFRNRPPCFPATGYGLDGPGIECRPGSSVGITTGYGLDGPGIECRPGSSVGIATGYGLDGPGIESRWERNFRTRPERPWGPPSLLNNGYGSFSEVKRPERGAYYPPLLAPRSTKSRDAPLLPPLRAFGCVTGCLHFHL